jgi:hypothetical protein
VQVHARGLSKLPKGGSRSILARNEHRRDVVNPRAPPSARYRVLRIRYLRERVVIHIRPAIRQVVATCSGGRTRGTHHSEVRTGTAPDYGLNSQAYDTSYTLQIVGSSSNYSWKAKHTILLCSPCC